MDRAQYTRLRVDAIVLDVRAAPPDPDQAEFEVELHDEAIPVAVDFEHASAFAHETGTWVTFLDLVRRLLGRRLGFHLPDAQAGLGAGVQRDAFGQDTSLYDSDNWPISVSVNTSIVTKYGNLLEARDCGPRSLGIRCNFFVRISK